MRTLRNIFALLSVGIAAMSLTGCDGTAPAAPAPVTIIELVTATFTPTGSATPTYTVTLTGTSTHTPTITDTPTDTFTSTVTDTPTSTWTPVTILVTATFTFTPTPSHTYTFTPTSTATATPSATATDTPNYTATPTSTATSTATDSPSSTPTGTATSTGTDTPTATVTSTATDTPTSTPAIGPTYAASVTFGSYGTMGNGSSLCLSGGNVWVLSFNQMTQWVVAGLSSSSTPVTTIANSPGTYSFASPGQVAADPNSGNIYACDRGNGATGQINVFDPAGNYLTSFGNSLFTIPNGGANAVAVNSSGTTVYALDSGNHQCYAWSITPGTPPTYTQVSTFGNSGAGAVSFGNGYMSWDNSGNLVLALGGNVINKYDYAGVYQQSVTLPGSQVLNQVIYDGSGNIYGIDTYSPGYVAEFDPAGAAVTHYLDGFTYPEGLAFDGTYDNLYITSGQGSVVVFTKQ